jgi:hypothetical protein
MPSMVSADTAPMSGRRIIAAPRAMAPAEAGPFHNGGVSLYLVK